MYRLIIILLLSFFCRIPLYAQFLHADEIFYRTSRQSILCPPEKAYLHTDRNAYFAGETIWMRAHVVDGIAHVPMKLSAYVYVTLQNPFLETIAQVRLKADKDGFIHGNIPLPEDLPKGEYSLCAYTQYMKNFHSEYFFKKRITISSVMNKSIRLETSQKGRNLDIRFINPATGETQEVKNCVAKLPSGEDAVLQPQDNGYSIKFHSSKDNVVLIQAGNYKEFVCVDTKKDYDVSFLPEGGNLVSGSFNRVAFKCINSLGQGEDIVGTLRNEQDSILLKFKSLYRGMGSLAFIPEPGKKYFAVCENSDGILKRFELPESTDKYTMQVNQIKDKVYVKVLFSPYGVNDEKLLVVAHQRGWPVKIGDWRKKTPGLVCNRDDFTEGVASFLLVNESGKIVSERMIFIQKDRPLTGKIHTDNPNPGKREKVTLQVKVSEKWWNGDCSVSVTDNHDVQVDSCVNILSSLLLSSDLRGYIESPTWYFEQDPNDSLNLRNRALDALMMTQGWRKYDIRKAWAKVYKEPELLPERSLQISGKVTTNVTRKPINKAKVQLMIPQMGVNEELNTNKDGTFRFENFDAPDSTLFWVSAKSEKGKTNLTLTLDTIIHPVLTSRLPAYKVADELKHETVSNEYLTKADLRLLNEKGIRHLFLDEVIVTAPRIEEKTEYEDIIQGRKSIKEEEIKQSGSLDLWTLLQQKVAGISIGLVKSPTGVEYPTILLRNSEVTLIVDKTTYKDGAQMDLLKTLYKEDVMQIDVIKTPFSLIYDPKAEGGVIAITTKQGGKEHNAQWITTHLKTIMPLGFQPPVEFYSPRYELATDKEKETPDLRTTIHWQPCLKVKNGKAEIEFYTADGLVDYSVVIEGVGEDGSLLHVQTQIQFMYY